MKIRKLLKYGLIIGGLLGFILGATACYMQLDDEKEEPRPASSKSDKNLIQPKVQSIQVIGMDEK